MRVKQKERSQLRRRRTRRAWAKRFLKVFEIVFCLAVMGVFTHQFIQYAEGTTEFQVRRRWRPRS